MKILLIVVIIFNIAQIVYVMDIDKPIPITTVNIVAGSTARLECDVRPTRLDDSAYLVLWYIETEKQPIYSIDLRARKFEFAKHWKNEKYATRAQFDISANPASFFLSSVSSEDDDGIYRCRVDFRHSPTRQLRYQLNVVYLPDVPKIFVNGEHQHERLAGPFDEGKDLNLSCEVAGGGRLPYLGVHWYRNGKPIDFQSEENLHNSYYNINIKSLSRSDHRATYTCQLELAVVPAVTPVACNITLSIRMRPATVDIILDNPYLEADKPHILQCKASGAYPTPTITWYIGNTQLTHTAAEITTSDEINGTVSTLLNFIPSVEDHNKILVCRAETPDLPSGFVEDSWRMEIYYPPQVKLDLGRRFTAEEIVEGTSVYLECEVKANPSIQRLMWKHNGKLINDSRNGDMFLANMTLVIQQTTRQTMGNYTCIAGNRQGETASAPLKLNIKYSPICRDPTPFIVVVSPGSRTNIHCQVEASDVSTVTFGWTLSSRKKSVLVRDGFQTEPTYSSLSNIVSSVLEYTPRDTDVEQLHCYAKNLVGKQKEPCTFLLVKEGLPQMPSQCVMKKLLLKSILEIKCLNQDSNYSVNHNTSVINSSNIYWLQLYSETGVLLKNVTSKTADFNYSISSIDHNIKLKAIITTINRQGRSDPVVLEGAVYERTIGSMEANNRELSVATMLIIGILLFLCIVGLSITLIIYKKKRKPSFSHDTNVSCSETKNSKQPDIIKSRQEHANVVSIGSNLNDYPGRSSLIVVTSSEQPGQVHHIVRQQSNQFFR